MRIRAVIGGFAVLLGVLSTSGGASAEGLSLAASRAKASPRDATAAIDYGKALRRAGQETESLAELRRAKGLTTDAARVEWEIARTYIAKRDFQTALSTCKGMDKAAPAASRACQAEAHLLWRRGTEAASELAELAKLKDASPEVQYSAKVSEGRIAELASKDSEAETAYNAAIKLAPTRDDAYVLLGSMQRRLGKDGTANLKKAVEVDEHDPIAQFELGRTLKAGSAESLKALENAVAEHPGYTDAMRTLVDGYVAANRLSDAKKTAEATLKIAPNDALTHVVVGRVALAEGKNDEAIKEGEKATQILANVASAKLLVADAQAKKGEIDFALEAYQAAFGLDHSDPTPLLNATYACIKAGRTTSAKAYARRATQEFDKLPTAQIALGDALVADGEKTLAKNAFDAAKKLPNADIAAIDTKLNAIK